MQRLFAPNSTLVNWSSIFTQSLVIYIIQYQVCYLSFIESIIIWPEMAFIRISCVSIIICIKI